MRKLFLFIILTWIHSILIHAQKSDLQSILHSLPDITEVKELKSDCFNEKYSFKIKQWVDIKDTLQGSFLQRVVLCHVGKNNPTVIVTEGYGGDYALNPRYKEELSDILNANIVFVEHRFFKDSTPFPCRWEYMTGENAANDLHKVRTTLTALYKNKWISTGISKGGENTLIYRAFYPNDVDFSVPYVAPLAKSIEDERIISFLNQVGNKSTRKKIKRFQQQCLKQRNDLSAMMKEYYHKNQLESEFSWNEIVDYTVLEFSFSFWQWHADAKIIPDKEATSEELFNTLVKYASPDYWAKGQDSAPFFVQAAIELGYYGYDTKPFEKNLSIKSANGYLAKVFLPTECKHIKHNDKLYHKLYNFLKKNDPKMIFIYGEYDPWTAAKIPNFDGKTNLQIYIQPKGTHASRINNMPPKIKKNILQQIDNWINN